MNLLKEIKNDFLEFCSTTTIQGLHNVSDPKQNCFSRILWIVVIVTSFVLAGICIKESFDGDIFTY